MLIIPALDIRNGKVVRLFRGDYLKEKIYSEDPLKIALKWEQFGSQKIHIVDLDAAQGGFSRNKDIIKKIAHNLKIDLELGGGIREESVILEYLNSGIKYLVIGTRAYLDSDWFKEMLKKYSGNIILALDVAAGAIKIKGWKENVDYNFKNFKKLLRDFVSYGLKTVIYTDVARDGTLQGPNVDLLEEFLKEVEDLNLELIFSGGLSSREDLKKIKNLGRQKIKGVIVGKALYEGKINLSEFKGGFYG